MATYQNEHKRFQGYNNPNEWKPAYFGTNTVPKDILDTFIGFDKMFERLSNVEKTTAFPPYNVVKANDDAFYIELAVAGFDRKELEVIEDNGILIVKGEQEEDKDEYLYKGIATRKFTRRFTLAEYMHVKAVDLVNGILSIAVIREIPAEKKPKSFTIK